MGRSSHYKKSGLAPAFDRVRMCELAVEHTSTWLMVDPWEAGQPEYQRTAVVLEHFDEMLNGEGRGVVMSDGRKRKFKVMLLAGGDLVESFGQPGVWSEPDVSPLSLYTREADVVATHHPEQVRVSDRRKGRVGCMGFPPVSRYTVPPSASPIPCDQNLC